MTFGSSTKSQVLFAAMEFTSDSIAKGHLTESMNSDASSYDVGSPASIKKIPGEYPSGGCDSLSDLVALGVALGVGVGVRWSKVESFGCAESVDLMREFSVTHETDLVKG